MSAGRHPKPGTAAGLQSALNDAALNNQPDQALIGSGTYVAAGVQGFTYSDAEELDITGSGSGSTIIRASAGASSSAMALSGGASASVLEGPDRSHGGGIRDGAGPGRSILDRARCLH